jgi:GNAT superfamily N-acetyltransferase
MTTRYHFKQATTPEELEQVFRLNHDVFAEELAQHQGDESGRLVDKFHDKNVYYVAVHDERVVGMIALHDRPPFSVAGKLADSEAVLAKLGRLIEVRLLAVEPAHRNGRVMAGLMLQIYQRARPSGQKLYDTPRYNTIVISGHAGKANIYRQLGYRDLGPAVKSGEALYIPMAVSIDDLAERQARWARRLGA